MIGGTGAGDGMKILELAEFYSQQGGGVRTYVEQKFQAARSAGHNLCVVAPGPEDRVENRSGGKLIWVKSPPLPVDKRYHLFWAQKPIDQIVAEERPDFIEGASLWRGAWLAGRQPASIPKALVVHQDPVSSYPQTILRNILTKSQIDALFAWFFRYFRRLQELFDTTIVASAWLAERLASAGLKRPELVPFGVDSLEFSHTERSESLRSAMLEECGVHIRDAKLLITVNRHHPEKRLPMLIEAFQAASSLEPMGLYIVGDGPSRAKIERLAAKTPGVHVAGFISDRRKLAHMLASADAYIHGCPTETFGMVIAEALCAGLPLILPSAGGAADLASPECAEFYEPDNAGDCASAVIRLLSRNQDALRAASLRSAARLSGTADHFRALFTAYERLVDGKSERRRFEQAPIGNDLPVCHEVA